MVSRAKNAKDAKIWIKNREARGLCKLSVLGAIIFLKLVLFNNSLVSIYTLALIFSTRSARGCRSKVIMARERSRKPRGAVQWPDGLQCSYGIARPIRIVIGGRHEKRNLLGHRFGFVLS